MGTLAAAAAAVAFVAAVASAAPQKTVLPGVVDGPWPFDTYSGTITVDESTGKDLFYLLAESQGDPGSDPLMVSLSGGPGCSSLLMWSEIVIMPVANESDPASPGVRLSPYAWNRNANVLLIDSPCGVGFSKSNTSSDYQTDNAKTTEDLFVFLQKFIAEFPRFNGSALILQSESYGGDYIPLLATRIINQTEDPHLAQQLAGTIVGNPVMSCSSWEQFSSTIQVNLFYNHALIPYSSFLKWTASGCAVAGPPADPCDALFDNITAQIGPFDSDNLYTDLRSGNGTLGIGPTPKTTLQQDLATYLNRHDVQEALHVPNAPTTWVACCSEPGQEGSPCQLNYTNHWETMLPYYDFISASRPDVRVWLYSGDTDIATCPHAYTQLCINELGRDEIEPWRPWTIAGQTAGYVQAFDGLTFATVKGAGHEVPMFQPRAAYTLFAAFLNGKSPP